MRDLFSLVLHANKNTQNGRGHIDYDVTRAASARTELGNSFALFTRHERVQCPKYALTIDGATTLIEAFIVSAFPAFNTMGQRQSQST